ncbi:Sec-independent protein translocase TatC [Tangfeifania diversioriginum]|uniref:Sec-independent protein translocase protein TatC n=1 Tax=Tangfeifania diversioriginum TaxID=1168035 RepID=A0A1M6GME6_9BACT|nr:twin-arginine translocase subunit TatC [Tangfeifania diversioriginum]SHJ11137.1 Sec-independent protein translocase TatC [Tangfeifania diversioriginum]
MSEEEKRNKRFGKKKNEEDKSGMKSAYAEMSFLEHMEELRWHIIRSALAIIVFAVAAFILKDFIFNTVILNPRTPDFWTNRMFAQLADAVGTDALRINQTPLELISIKIAGQFMTHIWVSIIAGFIIASPVVFYEFWRFIKPALYDNEKQHASGAVFFTSVLFLMGILFGYYLIVPLSIHFLGTYNVSGDVTNQINLKSYIGSVTSISLAAGVIFLIPIFSYFLSKVGLLTPQFMKTYRRHSYVVMLLLSAVITPPDIFSQIMVCFPLVFLYEIGIIISRRVVKKREKEMDEI